MCRNFAEICCGIRVKEEAQMSGYKYQLYVPGGNKTALVFGIDGLQTDISRRCEIQDKILARHADDPGGEVEQVGFVALDNATPALIMAGGEFCGNATRTAAAYYLQNKTGEIEISVSGASRKLRAGRRITGEVWAEMPVYEELNKAVTPLPNGTYWVEMDGISHLVVPQRIAAPILDQIFACTQKADQLRIAVDLLEQTIAQNKLPAGEAYGIMLLENTVDMFTMHPFVHVKTANTTYYESGCGSGAMSVGLVSSLLSGESVKLALVQPSGKVISADVERTNGKVRGRIAGAVECGEVFALCD